MKTFYRNSGIFHYEKINLRIVLKIFLLLLLVHAMNINDSHAQYITNYLLKTHNNSPEYHNSLLYDNGTNIGLGTNNPQTKFDVIGSIRTNNQFISSIHMMY